MLRRVLLCLLLLPCLVCAQDDTAPAYLLLLPPSVQTVLIAETDTATLHRFRVDANGLAPANRQHMSIGQNGVGKQVTGDRRTPLGVYFVLEELDTENLHEKYGPVAFPIDYPNAWDERNNRTGHGIWIHGVAPNSGPRPDRDTDGCIALPNADLLALQQFLTPARTPVIVTRSLQRRSAAEISAAREHLLAALDLWVSAYRDGDWHRFLSLYANDFSFRGMNRDEWSAFRLQAAEHRPLVDFTVDEVMLLADPEEAGLYVSRFRQTATEPGGVATITKRLYWREDAGGELRIVAEDNG